MIITINRDSAPYEDGGLKIGIDAHGNYVLDIHLVSEPVLHYALAAEKEGKQPDSSKIDTYVNQQSVSNCWWNATDCERRRDRVRDQILQNATQ